MIALDPLAFYWETCPARMVKHARFLVTPKPQAAALDDVQDGFNPAIITAAATDARRFVGVLLRTADK